MTFGMIAESVSTFTASGVAAGMHTILPGLPGKQAWIMFGLLNPGAEMIATLRLSGLRREVQALTQAQEAAREALGIMTTDRAINMTVVGNPGDPIEIEFSGVGSDGSYAVTCGYLRRINIPSRG